MFSQFFNCEVIDNLENDTKKAIQLTEVKKVDIEQLVKLLAEDFTNEISNIYPGKVKNSKLT